jgi:hypothetical protein
MISARKRSLTVAAHFESSERERKVVFLGEGAESDADRFIARAKTEFRRRNSE